MRKLFVGATVIASLAIIGVPAAMATPKGAFAVFAQCPLGTAHMNGCIYSPTESGHITIGKQEVPIVNTQVLQGGLLREEVTFVKQFVAAKNGETLTKTAQKVPGGLSGLVNCTKISNFLLRISCEAIFENGLTGVNAVTELAAPASTIYLNTAAEAVGEGTALNLPVKVKLENPLLGSECYIGSNSSPINIDLTTGATVGGPTGKPGTEESSEEGKILTLSGISLVSNTFSAPGASGCGLFGLLDGIINEKLGLPSAAGKNVAVLNGKVEIANAKAVEASE